MRELALPEGISINHFAAITIAGKLSALITSSYLDQKAARGERTQFEQALAKVSAGPADEQDWL